jgi:hypothetical protein
MQISPPFSLPDAMVDWEAWLRVFTVGGAQPDRAFRGPFMALPLKLESDGPFPYNRRALAGS